MLIHPGLRGRVNMIRIRWPGLVVDSTAVTSAMPDSLRLSPLPSVIHFPRRMMTGSEYSTLGDFLRSWINVSV